MAGIAALHDEAPSWEATDWTQIVGFYDVLERAWPTPVVALNRAVAIRFAAGPSAGLAALDLLGDDPRLRRYPYLAGARAECLQRLNRNAEAAASYELALSLTKNAAERAFLVERCREVGAERSASPGPSTGTGNPPQRETAASRFGALHAHAQQRRAQGETIGNSPDRSAR
jgi:RNA polymerase sigma-70 factor (ECF subfamily)